MHADALATPGLSVPRAHTYAAYVQTAPGAPWRHIATSDDDVVAYRALDSYLDSSHAVFATGYAGGRVPATGTIAALRAHYQTPGYTCTLWATDL